MKIQDKIRFMREAKQLSQEEMANRLNMSTYGYAKIERGETKANMPKLEQIAKVLEMDLMELLSFGEKNVACFIDGDNNQNSHNTTAHSALEIEKLQLVIEHQQALLAHKDKEIARLEEMLAMQKQLNCQQAL